MAGLELASTGRFVMTDDTIFFEATVDLDADVARVYDASHLRDGRALRHFTGLLRLAPQA